MGLGWQIVGTPTGITEMLSPGTYGHGGAFGTQGWIDPKKETDKLYGGGRFIPNVYIIDQRGTIRWQRVGTMEIGAADVIKSEVEKLLPNSKDGGA